MGGGFSKELNSRAGNWQGDIGRGDLEPHKQNTPVPTTLNLFGQQKGASVLDTSQNRYNFQGDLSAPHF